MASEPETQSIFQKICCCYSSTSKEPPVELIRTHSIAGPTTQVAKESVDGFEEINLENRTNGVERTNESTTLPAVQEVSEKEKSMNDDFTINDIMMDEICGENTIDDEHEVPLVEDGISIHTNVIEEVDEKELEMIKEQSFNTERQNIKQVSDDTPTETERSTEEKVSINQVLKEGYESPGRSEEVVLETKKTAESLEKKDSTQNPLKPVTEKEHENEKQEEKNQVSGFDQKSSKEDSENADDKESEEGIVETSRSYSTTDVAALLSARPDDDDDSEDEILIENVSPRENQPVITVKSQSTMYAESSDGEEDEEVEEAEELEIIRPPRRPKSAYTSDSGSQESESEGEIEEIHPVPSPRRMISSRIDEKAASEPEASDKEEGVVEEVDNLEKPISLVVMSSASEKENEGVTRLSVKSDGRAAVANGNVRVALDIRDLTDDEFSEQLI